MSLRYGFFNAYYSNGDYDRKYNAEDYSANMAAIISSGVRRDSSNGMRVTASGLVLSVAPGRAWIEGHWAILDSTHTFSAVVPPLGSNSRIDNVVLRLNTNDSERDITFAYVQGTASASPVAPAPTRSNGIYDIVLARVLVAPNATSVTVTDTRADKDVCGWITSPVGYDDYFVALDDAFNEWFAEKKDTLASACMFKEYVWRTVLESPASAVNFNIPQYDSTGVDILQVYVNGMLEIFGVDYTLSGNTITFSTLGGGTGTKVAGTEIVVICYKSINGEGLGSVSDEITELQNEVATISGDSEFVYVCNGLNDNVMLSELAQNWLNGGTDYASRRIRVIGTFGATAAYAGTGTSAAPYRWLSLGRGTASNRRITFDFSSCSQVNIACADNTHNIILFGYEVSVEGLNIVASGNATIYMFSTSSDPVAWARNCRFWISANGGHIARAGTFENCRVSVTTTAANAYAFIPQNASLLRLRGGEYICHAASGYSSAVVHVASGQTSAVAITYGINCPTVARSGYVQEYAILDQANSAKCSYTDTVTALAISAAGQNIRGTLAISKPGMM